MDSPGGIGSEDVAVQFEASTHGLGTCRRGGELLVKSDGAQRRRKPDRSKCGLGFRRIGAMDAGNGRSNQLGSKFPSPYMGWEVAEVPTKKTAPVQKTPMAAPRRVASSAPRGAGPPARSPVTIGEMVVGRACRVHAG